MIVQMAQKVPTECPEKKPNIWEGHNFSFTLSIYDIFNSF